jgi:hypothetical protein
LDLSQLKDPDLESSICVARNVVAKLYDPKAKYKSCHINLNKLRVRLATSKDCSLVRIPPSESAFKQHVLRASIQTKMFVRAKVERFVAENVFATNKTSVVQNYVLVRAVIYV